MPQRLQLTADLHMTLDGQPGIVLSGTVFDAPSSMTFAPGHVRTFAGTPNPVTAPTSVNPPRRQ